MPFDKRMDKENVVHLQNGVPHSRKNNEICSQMDGFRKHFERGNPDPERQLSYVLTHKWLLNLKQRKPAYKSLSQRT